MSTSDFEARLKATEDKKAAETRKIAAAQKIHAKANEFRGRLLNSVAVIERDLALLLTNYFCTSDPDKRELFFHQMVASRNLPLSEKKVVFMKIVEKDYPNYWKDNSEILKKLDKIMELRNKLAHSVVDVSDEALARPIENGVGFIEWKAGAPITELELQEWVAWANMVVSCIGDVRRLLPFKERPLPDEKRRQTPANS